MPYQYFEVLHLYFQYAVRVAVLVLLQSFALAQQQYGNIGGKPVTAEVVSREVGKVFTVKFVEYSTNNPNGIVNESTNDKNGLSHNGTYMLPVCVVSHKCISVCSMPIAALEIVDNSVFFYPSICCLLAPLRRVFTRVFPVPGTSVSSVQPYPYPERL